MCKIIWYLVVVLFPLFVTAQKKNNLTGDKKITNVSLTAENWTFKENKVEFINYKSRPAMKIGKEAGAVVLKNMDFTNGTIEFDLELLDPAAASVYFHWQSPDENECFYLRTPAAGDTTISWAVQYAPLVKGVNLWDLLFEYQTSADFKKEQWNHVKLVISGQQMLVYVNRKNKPTLQVPMLEGDVIRGTLAFDGEAIISNLVVKPNQVEGLPARAGLDPFENDPRYIRNWQVSPPLTIPKGIDYSADLFPNKETTWEPIRAERKGLVNLSRRFGNSEDRRIVWLKTTIPATTAESRKINLGFSDDVWVFLNGRPVYTDKNTFYYPIRKDPDGRISVENTSFSLPLKQGDNELLVGVANDFYGWGLIARLALAQQR